jgi:hypothetical protein
VPLGNSYSTEVVLSTSTLPSLSMYSCQSNIILRVRSIFGSRILNAKPVNRVPERKSGRLSVFIRFIRFVKYLGI